MATRQIKVLTDQEIALLDSLVKRDRQRVISNGRSRNEQNPYQAPECYLARIPDGGVAGAISMGTGSPATPSLVLPTTCDIYQLSREAGTGTTAGVDPYEALYAGFTEEVFNASPLRISSGFSPIVRDKFGFWYFTGPYELRIYGKMAEDITYGQTRTMNVYRNEVITSPLETVEVRFTWLGVTGQTIPAGADTEAEWWADLNDGHGGWRISNADCVAS